jgi:hypothetical protein
VILVPSAVFSIDLWIKTQPVWAGVPALMSQVDKIEERTFDRLAACDTKDHAAYYSEALSMEAAAKSLKARADAIYDAIPPGTVIVRNHSAVGPYKESESLADQAAAQMARATQKKREIARARAQLVIDSQVAELWSLRGTLMQQIGALQKSCQIQLGTPMGFALAAMRNCLMLVFLGSVLLGMSVIAASVEGGGSIDAPPTGDKDASADSFMKDKDWRVRQVAVEKITEPRVLAEIALEDTDCRVRLKAVEKSTDQVVLAKVAVTDADVDVRRAAVRRLTDQGALGRIATEDTNQWVRGDALKNLTDRVALAKIAVTERNWVVRYSVVERLTDRVVLAKITVEDTESSIRQLAAKKLAEQNVLAKIGRKEEGHDIRETAAARRRVYIQCPICGNTIPEEDSATHRCS